jgi:hypothetical protein
VRLQDFLNLESTQESMILDEEKTILEHNKNRRFLCHQNMKYFEVIKNPEHAPEFIPRVFDIILIN